MHFTLAVIEDFQKVLPSVKITVVTRDDCTVTVDLSELKRKVTAPVGIEDAYSITYKTPSAEFIETLKDQTCNHAFVRVSPDGAQFDIERRVKSAMRGEENRRRSR
jgi:hypothetical protein